MSTVHVFSFWCWCWSGGIPSNTRNSPPCAMGLGLKLWRRYFGCEKGFVKVGEEGELTQVLTPIDHPGDGQP